VATDTTDTARTWSSESLQEAWKRSGIQDAELAPDDTGTIRALPETSPPFQPAMLPLLVGTGPTAELEISTLLGQGGMGAVWLASQRSLGREVAVKTVRPDRPHASTTAQLLLEARVTGSLEHPHVVPVHTLGRDPEGGLYIAMKRIEGRSWTERLRATRGSPEHLSTHLRILISVCDAVKFAQTRQVLHRDLKPDNVMLGEFGEVYVVDWGLAVALGPRAEALGLAPAKGLRQVAGTPGYLAPEMAAGDGEHFGPWSDVYLLGAILHEVLTGRPRHDGPTMLETLTLAYRSAPVEYGPEAPTALAEIANRATHPLPAERYQSAAEFGDALVAYQDHAGSIELADLGERRLAQAQVEMEGSQGGNPLERTRDWIGGASVRRLVEEARFAFQQALQTWPENRAARVGLGEVLKLMIARELERGEVVEALALYGELPAESPDLRARIDARREEVRREAIELKRLRSVASLHDLTPAARVRSAFCVVMSVAFLALNLVFAVLHQPVEGGTPPSPFTWLYLVSSLAMGGVFQGGALLLRKTLFVNVANIRLAIANGAEFVAVHALLAFCLWRGVAFETALTLQIISAGGASVVLLAWLDPRGIWYSAGAVVYAAISAVWPSTALYCAAAGWSTFYLVAALIWGRPEYDGRPSAPRRASPAA
jgi:serine/threonine-protein kinase